MMIMMMMMMIIDDNDSDDDDNLSKHPVGSIAHVRGDGELRPLALGHLGNALVPTGNHLQSRIVVLMMMMTTMMLMMMGMMIKTKNHLLSANV